MALRTYMASMDSPHPERTLDLLEPDFRFLIALPGSEITGESKEDFAAYIAGRNPKERSHEILRHSRDGDLETVYGVVTEGGRYTGSFLSAAVISPGGLIARYQSFFTTSFELVDWAPRGDGSPA
ncbi:MULTISPECIES: nuclear transport factor 2 family protein [Streptomyces]|uniref:Nuclear transport factor 2 family protein n=1 Tax=Streptomyces rhizosphaericus TaxID=114699 RepID=A0A6G4AMX4_9ACTN|nr:nuclear transport factor 2 family protein [Streptomyces rhizosphaericus]MBI0380375.1 nuclear transport factor 2 family protein [Streptomyces albiflaviniger]NEW74039.1 nuclear transport factor 2 family protein [Streptomyces rhizosphaericus]